MSNTIVVMKDGAIQQIGTPEMMKLPKNVLAIYGENNIILGRMVRDRLVNFAEETLNVLTRA